MVTSILETRILMQKKMDLEQVCKTIEAHTHVHDFRPALQIHDLLYSLFVFNVQCCLSELSLILLYILQLNSLENKSHHDHAMPWIVVLYYIHLVPTRLLELQTTIKLFAFWNFFLSHCCLFYYDIRWLDLLGHQFSF